MGWLDELLARKRGEAEERRRERVSASTNGLTVKSSTGVREIGWPDIRRIAAFQRDIFVGEVVCVAIETADATTLHLVEGDDGWLGFMRLYAGQLPGALPLEGWLPSFAAGASKPVVVYDRTQGSSALGN